MITIPFVGFMSFPLIYYTLTGEKIPMFPLFFPYINADTMQGYIIYYVIHIVWCVLAGLGIIGADSSMALLFLHALPMVEVFEQSISEMNEVLVNLSTSHHSSQLKEQLSNIILMHKEIFK